MLGRSFLRDDAATRCGNEGKPGADRVGGRGVDGLSEKDLVKAAVFHPAAPTEIVR